jgi:hypothetical protein
MNALTTIKETVKALIDTLYFSCIIPAIIFVLVNFSFVLPVVFPKLNWSLETSEALAYASAFSLSLSYILFSSNYGLTRFLEGYKWENTSLGIIMKKRHEQIRKKLVNEKRFDLIDTFYPGLKKVLPTKFGNVIASSEFYPYRRYGMDSIILWPRVLPILVKEKFSEFVSQKKTSLDLFMNMFFVTIILSIELTSVFFYLHEYDLIAYSFIFGTVLTIIFYNAAIMSAIGWGLSIRVTFDVYKENLRKAFKLKPVNSFKEEKEQWKSLCHFIDNNSDSENLFDYSLKNIKNEPS